MRTFIWAAVVLAAAACSNKDNAAPGPVDNSTTSTGQGGMGGTEGTGGEAGTGGDTGDASDEGAVPCGAKSCNAGEYCCDGACGACVAVGMNCPVNPCGTDGAAE